MNKLALLLVVAFVAAASALGSWTDLYQPPFSSCPTIMMGISCTSASNCYVPGGTNGQGFDVYTITGDANGAFNPLRMPVEPLMLMSIAMGGTASSPHGAVAGLGIQFAVNSTTFMPAIVPELLATVQNIRSTAGGMELLAVDQDGNHVLWSADGGFIFAKSNINIPMPSNCTGARYGAIVDANNWYVTFGSWPQNSKSLAVTARVGYERKNGKVKRVVRKMLHDTQFSSSSSSSSASSTSSSGGPPCPYSAVIAKTADAGKTWTSLVSLSTDFYYNAIDCADVNNCIAVGEGFDSNPGVHVWRTTNGQDFTEVYFLNSTSTVAYSLMSVRFSGKTEVWAAGSAEQSLSSSALLLYSSDSGATWTDVSNSLTSIGDITDMTFTSGGVGYAVAVTVFDDSTVLRYDPKGPSPTSPPGPTTAPPTPGTFTQMDCSNAACSQGCQNISFPTSTCLQVNGGGSAIVTCSATALLEQIYSTNDCTGTAQANSMPLDQCLQSTNGYFENFCSSSVSGRRGHKIRTTRRH